MDTVLKTGVFATSGLCRSSSTYFHHCSTSTISKAQNDSTEASSGKYGEQQDQYLFVLSNAKQKK